MRKPVFIFLLIVISAVIILSTFSGFRDNSGEAQKKELNNFLSIKDELLNYDNNLKTFKNNPVDNAEYFYHSINPIDGIYYKKGVEKNPIKITVNNSGMKINVSTGQYVFVLNDVFQKYEILGNGFKISQLGKGIFFLNNDVNDYKIYSINSILEVGMVHDSKNTTYFKLFPSLLFKHNFLYTRLLKSADILRISMVDSIYYLDYKDPNTATFLTNAKQGENNLIKITVSDIANKLEKYKKIYEFVLKIRFNEIPGYGLIINYQSFFDNQNKKEVYLKSTLIKSFLDLVNDPKNQNDDYANISSSLDELANISAEKKEEGISLIKSYYYLSYYGRSLIKEDSDILGKDIMNSNVIIRQILNDKKASEDYFSTLSDMYFGYSFSSISKDSLDLLLNNYLADIKKRKVLKDEDFLPFSFFLTQYTLSNTEISQNGVNIIVYLIEMFDNYYGTINDDNRGFNALGVQFYNFSKIITNVNNGIFKKYFQKTQDGIVLKPEYIKTNNVTVEATNLGENTIEFLSLLYRTGYNDLQNKKPFFDKNLSSFYDKEVLMTNYSELEKKYNSLLVIINTLNDYNKYIDSLKLNSRAKSAKALIFNDAFSLSTQDLYSYIIKFNGVDINRIRLLNQNTMNHDKFYDVEIYISGNKFTFKLNPEGHILSNVMIYDVNGVVNSIFSTQAISLDEKQKVFLDKYNAEQDYYKKEKYSFADFFNIVFLSDSQNNGGNSDLNYQSGSENIKTNEESKFISVFKQDNLIDGDFRAVSKFINIPFANISANIINGEYQIKINNIRKTFTYQGVQNTVDIDNDYNFVDKYFYNIKMRIYNTDRGVYDYNGAYIKIIPMYIMTQEFSNKLENIGQYLYTLRKIYPQGQGNIEFNLNLGKVFINSKDYDLLK